MVYRCKKYHTETKWMYIDLLSLVSKSPVIKVNRSLKGIYYA